MQPGVLLKGELVGTVKDEDDVGGVFHRDVVLLVFDAVVGTIDGKTEIGTEKG